MLSQPRGLVVALAEELRGVVLPELGSHAGRGVEQSATGGDVTFAIDERAERALERFLRAHAPGVAFFSEDRGLVTPADRAEHVLLVDPIDGTRPAMAGFEAACVSVALAPLGNGPHPPEPAMGDVEVGCVVEIKSGARFVAERGRGVEVPGGVRLSANSDLSRLLWAYGLRGRPARAVAEVLADLLDGCLGGGAFELGAATFDMTRVLTGQLDAYVEPSPRLVEEVPGMRAEFERIGGGHVLNNTPYDLAAATLCLLEGGAVVTDAAGRDLARRPLLGAGVEHQMSVVAAANRELHERLLEAVQRGMDRVRAGSS